MDTVTEQTRVPAQEHPLSPSSRPEPIDPEKDFDAKKTVIWLVSAVVFVVVSLVALFQFFAFSIEGQRYNKIDLAPTEVLRELRSDEDQYLKKEDPLPGDARDLGAITESIKASTDQIIEAYLKK